MDKKKVLRFELKQILKKRGLTYEEFGKRFSPQLDKQTIYGLANRKSITFEMLERIVNALDLEQEEIVELFRIYE